MTTPIVLRPETDIAVSVLALMVITEAIASCLRRLIVEPATWKDPARSLNTHHCRAGAGVFDRRGAFEAGFDPVIDIAFTADVVGRHAVVRQMDHSVLPAATP